MVIKSPENKFIKEAAALVNNKSARDKAGLFTVEGAKFVGEIKDCAAVERIFVSESFAAVHDIGIYRGIARDTVTVADNVYKKLSDVVNPQGITAVCRKPSYKLDDLLDGADSGALLLVLEETNDPGNLGTMIRTADAAGATGVILCAGCADIYNPKAIRASAGSVFHLPFITGADIVTALNELKKRKIRTFAAHLSGTKNYYDCRFNEACAAVIGNEARGLSGTAANMADELIKIPLLGRAESLNASAACGIILYEALKQRLQGKEMYNEN